LDSSGKTMKMISPSNVLRTSVLVAAIIFNSLLGAADPQTNPVEGKPVVASPFNLSPSLVHKRLAEQVKPKLAYNGQDFSEWQSQLKSKLAELVGEMPKERSPLNVRSLWKRPHEFGSIEKIVFTSEPLSDVPAYVCIPKDAKPPYLWMICLQGHSTGMHVSVALDQATETQIIPSKGDRDYAIGCMRRGIAALCIEQRSFGERGEKLFTKVSPEMCNDAAMQALLVGRTLLGERVYDVDRAIDYLETRKDVDMKRLGIMGNSGGGMISIYAAALLPRIQFSMPSCSFCGFKDSLLGSTSHCADVFIPGLFLYADMGDLVGLIAPRPVVIVAGKKDHLKPMAAVEESYRQVERIYKAAGAESNCKLVVGPEGHQFYADLAWPEALKKLESLKK
jgi:dienelactone hydrolase